MKIKSYIVSLALFFSMLACGIPGLGQPVAPPTFDLSKIPTMVAMTANALNSQTAVAAPPTPTPLPTESLPATPNISLSGTSLLMRDDLTTVFTDRQAGIEILIPIGWMPVRLNEKEYYDAFVSEAAKDPAINERLTRIQSLDPGYFRLDVIDIQPGHIINGAITDINVIFQQNDPRTLKEVAKDEKANKKPYENFRVISSSYKTAVNGMQTLVIEQKWDAPTGTTYYKGVFFKLPSGVLVFDFYSPFDFKDVVLLDYEKIVNSMILLNP